LSSYLAEGLRRAILLTTPADRSGESAGLLLLAPDNTITRADTAAEQWLADLRRPGQGELPSVVTAVASQARGVRDGRTTRGSLARARVRTPSGHWLIVRASTLGEDAETAVILEPAGPHDLAPLIADAYGLSERERTVTRLVAQGLPTNAIADQLHLSPWTVQDHLKSIFGKVGATTRGELVARLYFGHSPPPLS
jgi:DNA-binding CsgD family transcriptional regulator